jgi:hypothetical protein
MVKNAKGIATNNTNTCGESDRLLDTRRDRAGYQQEVTLETHQQGLWQRSIMPDKTGTGSIDVRSKRRPTISVLMVKGEECLTPCLSKLLSVEAGSVITSVKRMFLHSRFAHFLDVFSPRMFLIIEK